MDTLLQIVPNLFRYSAFDKSSNVYQNLVNSGELKILDHFSKEIMNTMDLSLGKIEHPELLYTSQFHNMFFIIIGVMEEKNEIYQEALRQIDKISVLIEEEFKN